MLKTLAFALTLGAASVFLAADAGAVPLAQGKQTIGGSDISLVREGCGPGRQYSKRLRRCVEDTPEARMRDNMRRACGPGWHYSARFNRCVRN